MKTEPDNLLDKVCVIIVTYNHANYMVKCLNSIYSQGPVEIVIVDNNSTDETTEIIENNFQSVKLIKNTENLGFSQGVNCGVSHSTRDNIMVLNPDTWTEKNSILNLLEPLINQENIVTVPKVLIYDGSVINTIGNTQHVTGLSFTRYFGENPENHQQSNFITGLSGVCFAMRRNDYLKLGGFDRKFFIYMEDVEMSWKINSNGFQILYVPNSIIYHDYELNVTARKLYHLEKGRYYILRKYFTWREYLIISPSLLTSEVLTWGFSIIRGPNGLKYKIKAIIDAFRIEISDNDINHRKLLENLDWEIPIDQLSYNVLDRSLRRVANFIYTTNQKLIKTKLKTKVKIPTKAKN